MVLRIAPLERSMSTHYLKDEQQTSWFAARRAATAAAFLLPHLEAGMNIVDIGCGAATITLDLARIVYPGHVIGIERDEGQLARARANLQAADLDNVTIIRGDANDLDLLPDSLDAIVAFSTLEYLPDPQRVLLDAYRALKPGGLFAARDRALDGDVIGGALRQRILDEWELIARVWEGYLDVRIGHRLRGMLAEAGFDRVQASASHEVWGTEEQMADLLALHRGAMGPEGWSRKLHLESGLIDEAGLDEQYRVHHQWAADPGAWFAMCRAEVVGWKSSS
jgi:SAM-dependent methyltransferase